jgi:predicted nucleic acid-binding protein
VIVLDTNVVSELMKPRPSQAVDLWLGRHFEMDLFTTVITQVEIFIGIEIAGKGRRRDELISLAVPMFDEDFADRVLSFDRDAAREMARILAHRRSIGRPIGLMDAQIAAIARSHGAQVATRDTADFEHCGVPVVDPWTA